MKKLHYASQTLFSYAGFFVIVIFVYWSIFYDIDSISFQRIFNEGIKSLPIFA